MGLTSPLGHTLTLETGKKGTIIGVIKDAHFSSLRDNIDPLIMSLDNKQGGTILVRIAPGHIRETMAGLKQLCTSMNPGSGFSIPDLLTSNMKSCMPMKNLPGGWAPALLFWPS